MNTYGNEAKIIDLFGTPTSKKIDKDGDFFNYKFESFKFGFSALLSNDYNKPILSKLELTNPNSTIKINQVDLKIGDNINKLGNINHITTKNGNKAALFSYCDGCNNYFSIEFNPTTNLITEITYIEMT